VYASLIHAGEQSKKVRLNDVVVFKFPYINGEARITENPRVYYCKRCVATPGTLFYIDKQGVFHNSESRLPIGNRKEQLRRGYQPVKYDSVYVPRAGDVVEITARNMDLYQPCIEYETQTSVSREDDRFYLAGDTLSRYQFRKSYYFMAGDNVGDSYDSRHWGLVPENFIFAKAQFIWFSFHSESKKVEWKRIFRKVGN
jgi:signal peptidase I